MQDTVNIAQEDAGRRSSRGPGRRLGARPSKRFGGLIPRVSAVLLICIFALATVALAQGPQKAAVAQSDAQKSFEKLKALAGSWQGRVTTVPKVNIEGNLAHVSFRVASMGNVLMHDMRMDGIPDNPITMFYLEADQMHLTHYCDAGNRPRMAGKVSPDGKTFEFAFIDVAGGTQKGHMHNAVITIIDANHHTEDWTFMLPGDKSVRAHFDLKRAE